MSKLAITLYNREYTVNCDPGEEPRLGEIVKMVEKRMQDVAGRVGNTTEQRLLMLTCLHMADELLDITRKMQDSSHQDEEILVAAVEHLKQRVTQLASQVGHA